MRKLIFISLIVSLISSEVFSQSNLLNAKNPSEIGVSSSMDKINPSFLEYPEIDEKDILWSKVVYEYIDLNEKLNFPLLFPVNDEQYTDTRKSLWKIIRENIENGTIDEVFDVRNELKSEFNFKNCIIEPQKTDFIELPMSTDYSKITKGTFATLSPLYSLKRLGEIISNFKKKYDFIIVTRTDTGCSDKTKFLELELSKEKFYSSYVGGREWLVTHIDARWFCGNQEKITQLCSTYDRLTEYIVDDKIPLCHHRMFLHSMKKYKKDIEMVIVDPSSGHGGWFYLRNGKISLS